MSVEMTALAGDLETETACLRSVLRSAPLSVWNTPTAGDGWTVGDQIGHLAYFDDVTVLAMEDASEFAQLAKKHVARGPDFPDRLAASRRFIPVRRLSEWFVASRSTLLSVAAVMDPEAPVPWYGPPRSAEACVTARIAETWVRRVDIADAIGRPIVPSAGLRHVAQLAVEAFAYSFASRKLPVPTAPVRVELQAPDGGSWVWGPEEATDIVQGTAVDFCLVMTHRRHRWDTELIGSGSVARAWIELGHAFGDPSGADGAPARRVLV